MKIQQEKIREYPKIREIREHFLSWIIPVIRYCCKWFFYWTRNKGYFMSWYVNDFNCFFFLDGYAQETG